jgi:hypothetical protein
MIVAECLLDFTGGETVRILVADPITFAAAFAQYDALHYVAIGRCLASFE